ncbi:MAG: putative cytidylate kinase [Candidatus Latescibacterota bacterium]|jgi:predicted cytidylate kinase
MSASILTISGLPGSGTSTACKLLRERLGWSYVNAGEIFRTLAREAGLSLAEFGQRAEEDACIDRALDARMVATARVEQPIILEGRLTGWMALRSELDAVKIWIEAEGEVRAQRVRERDGETAAAALEKMLAREASEAQRYRQHHGIEIGDRSMYDLVIDSAVLLPEEIVQRIEARLEGR